MIRRFVGRSTPASLPETLVPDDSDTLRIVPRADHNVSRSDISRNAVKVLYRLHNAGFQAFLVGGGVRDLVLEGEPKDFDVATDAHPEEVRELFRNCRLIGRRFRLAHIRFGREIIEVATFRAAANPDEDDARSVQDDEGRILRDNVYGSIEEDVWRRDLTINALYYNIADFSIWDFANGLEDLRDGVVRLIGDPESRYREDPVRMLRAVRFAAKLGFEIEASTRAPFGDLAHLLEHVPPARLFDEVIKLFQTGYGLESFRGLREAGLFAPLFTETEAAMAAAAGDVEFVERGLGNTDSRIAEDKPVTPLFLFAVLLWPAIRRRSEVYQERQGSTEVEAIREATSSVLSDQLKRISIPKRFSLPMREVLELQPRFGIRRGAKALRFLSHRRFRAAYDFMLLRVEAGEVSEEIAQWWTEIQALSAAEQRALAGVQKRRRRKPRRKRPAAAE